MVDVFSIRFAVIGVVFFSVGECNFVAARTSFSAISGVNDVVK